MVTGHLAAGDGELDPVEGGYYDLYSFRVRSGEVFCIRMSSADFDPVFAVGDTAHGEFVELARGTLAAVQGDSEARLRWTAPWSGDFQLRPTALGLIAGIYRLALEAGPGVCPSTEGVFEEDTPGAAASGQTGTRLEVSVVRRTGPRTSALGKFRNVLGSSDAFPERKQDEIDFEDRRSH